MDDMHPREDVVKQESAGEMHGGEDFSIEDLTVHNDYVLNALIELLIEKKVITEDELNSKIDELEEEAELEEESGAMDTE